MNIYQHFRPEERDYIDQVMQWKNTVELQYAPKLTDFLDPREQHILKTIIGENGDVKYQLFGGWTGAERKRALLFPEYLVPAQEDFQISLFEIDYPKKFVKIEHPNVLGTLMSLGLKRGKFGDILVDDGQIQFLAAKEIGGYISSNLESIGKATVHLIEKPPENIISPKELWEEHELTVSSLRLDTVISGVYNLSRQKSQNYIAAGLVKVNWTQIESPAFVCEIGDMLSVRGHGRVRLSSIDGKTKKEKWRISVGRQK
ncbi:MULTISPECIES: RNA-binding protein [Neobacillus]|uniref:RNA-binding protein n=1 Tax=Neobacillus citreus TaxID=2833578 RepID=A0A942Y6T9_9BACI|nr:RNA-binding protein [Neobacillus citreus]MCH6268357.1 RNA-binding protein [Neobacillus citreus]